jgi:hypothetical protein
MARYQTALIRRPSDWKPATPDAVPEEPGKPLEILGEFDDVFAAVRQAVARNQSTDSQENLTWAVVVEPGVPGRTWPSARICTPIVYRVAAIWWPAGWEPQSASDVPNCVWKAQGNPDQRPLDYRQAMATVEGLNRQAMNQPGSLWYVMLAVENEPVSQTVSYDPSGIETTVEVRRLYVVRPEEGVGRGDCSYCPAHALPCAREDWVALEQTETATRTRPVPPRPA